MRFDGGPTLLVIDEFRYFPVPAEATSTSFQFVAQRYSKTSIVIAINRSVLLNATAITSPTSFTSSPLACLCASVSHRWSKRYLHTADDVFDGRHFGSKSDPRSDGNRCGELDFVQAMVQGPSRPAGRPELGEP